MNKHQLTATVVLIGALLIAAGALYYTQGNDGLVVGKIQRYIRDTCRMTTPCTLNLRELTPFSWDLLFYVENSSILHDGVKGQIHRDLPDYPEVLAGRLIFIHEDELVRSEKIERGIEEHQQQEIIIRKQRQAEAVSRFTPESAIFDVELERNSQGEVYYKLVGRE